MTPELAALLVALAQMVPGLIEALRPDVAASVRDQLARARTLLPPAGSVSSAVEAVIARREASLADEMEAIAQTQGALLSARERASLRAAAASLRGMPPVLETPRGAWSEPHEGD